MRVSARQRRGAGGEGLAALSGREREIAELVAQGRTNKEIAGTLFLAEKTVEGHLTNVFAKLGVSVARRRRRRGRALGRRRRAAPPDRVPGAPSAAPGRDRPLARAVGGW